MNKLLLIMFPNVDVALYVVSCYCCVFLSLVCNIFEFELITVAMNVISTSHESQRGMLIVIVQGWGITQMHLFSRNTVCCTYILKTTHHFNLSGWKIVVRWINKCNFRV